MYKKILTIIIVLVSVNAILGSVNEKVISTSLLLNPEEPVQVGVLLSDFNDFYISSVKKAMEDVEKQNEGKVKYFFFDGQKSQATQNSDLNKLLQESEIDLILINLVNSANTKYAIERVKENNIPVIFIGAADRDVIKSYNKAYWLGADPAEGGILQGKIVVDIWNKNKENIDKNKNKVMEYVMLQGEPNNIYAIERTKQSILTANDAGIKTKELALEVCNWSEEEARNATKVLFSKFGNQIEMVIANNDAMAIGTIRALQEFGYNKGDKKMTIPIIGFDGIKVAEELIKEGIMAGTVIQDPYDYATNLYIVGMNLIYNRDPLEGTECKFYDSTTSILIPYRGVITNIS